MSDPKQQRYPTDRSYKTRVLKKLDEISRLYEYTNIQMQTSQYQGTVTQEMLDGMINYTSKIITLYKMLKPKMEVGFRGNPEKQRELETIDEYQMIMDEVKKGFNVEKAFILFTLFGVWEDLLRELCENLGYISDDPEIKE